MKRDDVRFNSRFAGQVLRYHTWPVQRQQSVGEHSWQVYRIYMEIFGPPTREVAAVLLLHDVGELVVGDPPFPVKREHPDFGAAHRRVEDAAVRALGFVLPDLPDLSQRRIKLCDLIEMYEFGLVELMQGNQYARPIVDDISDAMKKLVMTLQDEEDHNSVARYLQRWIGVIRCIP